MKKLTAIMCVILVFTTTTIPVYAEEEIYIEPGQNVSENMESENVESENVESENMESENMESVDETEDAGEPVDEYGIALLAEETSVVCGDFTISGDDLKSTEYSYSNNVLTILSSKAITVSTPDKSADNPTTADRIVVDSPDGADITLSGVYISCGSYAAFEIISGAEKVTVTLDGDNTLKSGGG